MYINRLQGFLSFPTLTQFEERLYSNALEPISSNILSVNTHHPALYWIHRDQRIPFRLLSVFVSV